MAKYNSHIKKLRIVLKPAMPVYEGGVKVSDQPGEYAQFEDGQFESKDEAIIEKLESLGTFKTTMLMRKWISTKPKSVCRESTSRKTL